ncbi:MAG: hypothetical protein II781_05200, partial [Clostridia bacterium]|nr:hypothetical protein [Clostridia bacterium]
MIRFLRASVRKLEPFSFAVLCGLFAGGLLFLWSEVLLFPLSFWACTGYCILLCVLIRLLTWKWQVFAVFAFLIWLSISIFVRNFPETAQTVWKVVTEVLSFSWNYLVGAYTELTPLQEAYLPYTALLMGAGLSLASYVVSQFLPLGLPVMAAGLGVSAWFVFLRNPHNDLTGFLAGLTALLSFLPALFARRITDERKGNRLSPKQAAWYIIPFTVLCVGLFSTFVPRDTSGMYLPALRAPVQDLNAYIGEKNGVTVRRTDNTFTYRAMGYGNEATGTLGG